MSDVFGRSGPAAFRRALANERSGRKSGITITGVQEIMGNLETFTREVAPAEIRKGTRAAAYLVMREFQARVPVKSGSMRDSVKVRAIKRTRKKIGHTVVLDRNKLFKLYEARTGKKPTARTGDSEPFFYPAVVELGDKDHQADRPLRGALYENETAVKHEFAMSLLRAVNHPKIKHKK